MQVAILLIVERCVAAPIDYHHTTMNTIRFAGAAGRVVGTAVALINWAEVLEIVLHGLKVLVVLCLLAGRATRRCWDALPILSERLGNAYAALIAPPLLVPAGPALPAPVAITEPMVTTRTAAELLQLTNRELRELVGTRKRLAKRELVAMALAA